MATTNVYWPVYKNLENEVLKLADFLHFSDDQTSVYSMHIADLIIRCAVEIESIAKELYSLIGGNAFPVDKNGKPRDLYFDTDCLDLLEQRWNLSKKQITVSSINFYFTDEKNRVLTPLHKANKRGTNGSKWKQAYQAVKHDRRNSIKKGNIENLLNALGALFILNVYYRDDSFSLGRITSAASFDSRLGSDIFSVFVAHAEKVAVGNDVSDSDIELSIINELSRSIYIKKYEDESLRKIHKNIVTLYQSTVEKIIQSPKVIEFLNNNQNYKITNVIQLAKDAGGTELLKEITSAGRLAHGFTEACYEVILNKGNQIYPTLTEQDATTEEITN